MIKFPVGDPRSAVLAAASGLAAWKASNFATDLNHLMYVATAMVTSHAIPTSSSSNPNVAADSHITTPYVNNLDVQ